MRRGTGKCRDMVLVAIYELGSGKRQQMTKNSSGRRCSTVIQGMIVSKTKRELDG